MTAATMKRYDTAIPVATGGVGEVLKAWDNRLERWVALKTLLRDDPSTIERFSREAKAQSRLDHPNICKVHEVGEDNDGHAVLVMQFIDGENLDVAAESMPLEEQIRVLRTVAEAVHFANSKGIIHRDLKPSNILVERLEDGSSKPYVVDFGLASIEDAEFLTRTGEVLGTPAFMAPEQARGDNRAVDRRTDVYALGAVLYSLLTGRPPFEAATPVGLLAQILDQEPQHPSFLNPGVPPDLGIIAITCLQKDPRHRFDSAQALADDLGRWLEGRPITARPPGKTARLIRLIRRRPIASAAIAVASLALATAGAISVNARLEAREQMNLARDLGAEEERLAARIRYIHMLPLHDITEELQNVRQEMAAIEVRIQESGEIAEGPGNAALGRTHLALGDFEEARQHLESAINSGFERAEVRSALGQTLTWLYRIELTDAARESDSELRRLRIQKAQEELRDPALKLLGSALSGSESERDLTRAAVALLEDRYDDALQFAGDSIADQPWRHEAKLLAGDALLDQALKTGREDHDATVAGLEQAASTYRQAIEIAPSDPLTHLRLCDLADKTMDVLLHENREGIDFWYEEAQSSCSRAIRAKPTTVTAHLRLSSAHTLKARLQQSLGEDSTPILERAIATAQQGVTFSPNSAEAHRTLGDAQLYLAYSFEKKGGDPGPERERAISSLERALDLDPANVSALNSLGLIHIDIINYARDRGFDPMPSVDAGIEAFTRAAELLPDYTHAFSNLGIVYRLRGEHELRLGLDPTRSVESAAESFQRAIKINPSYTYAYNNLGNVYRLAAKARMARGNEPDELMAQALEQFAEASRRSPDWSFPYLNAGIAHRLLAQYLVLNDQDPGTEIDLALRDLEKGIKILGDHPLAWVELAEVHLASADSALRQDHSPEVALRSTEEAVRLSLAQDPNFAEAHRLQGEINLIRAQRRLDTDQNPNAALQRARAALERSIEQNPRAAATSVALAHVSMMQSRLTRGDAAQILADEAITHAQRALELNPGNSSDELQAVLQSGAAE